MNRTNMKTLRYTWILLLVAVLAGCSKTYTIPTNTSKESKEAKLYPDYTDVVIPANIAPLNFQLQEPKATEVVAHFQGEKGGEIVTGDGEDLKIQIDTTEWHNLLQQNRGADIKVTVYAHIADTWIEYKSHTLTVAEEDIDPYLSYRLIEPGYELYRQLGLYQRNLTNWDQEPIYENNRVYEEEDNHCINCHNYQNYSTKNMLFHVRANHGGTIIIEDGKAQKVQIKGDSILTAGVYPSWHPTQNLVAFSTNKTGQTFHMFSKEKIEVLDEKSDLLLYDVEKNQVSMILNDNMKLETFPCWSPDGNRLYYCVADEPVDERIPDSLQAMKMVMHYDSLLYDIKYLDFDQKTHTFGQPQTLCAWSQIHKSATFPRVSPDGRYLLYALGDYGQFHIWHKSSDLWVTDLTNGNSYPLKEANSDDVDSYHTWSSNGRWIVFSSRRMDGNYTRPFIAYFDKKGHAHKAFCLPQEDPEQNILLLKSYNVPELTKDKVHISEADLRKCIYEPGDGKTAEFKSR